MTEQQQPDLGIFKKLEGPVLLVFEQRDGGNLNIVPTAYKEIRIEVAAYSDRFTPSQFEAICKGAVWIRRVASEAQRESVRSVVESFDTLGFVKKRSLQVALIVCSAAVGTLLKFNAAPFGAGLVYGYGFAMLLDFAYAWITAVVGREI